MKARTLQVISLFIAFVGGLFALDATIRELGFIDPRISQWWPIVMAVGTIISRIGALIGDVLDDGQINGSFGRVVTAIAIPFFSAVTMFGLIACATNTPQGRIGNAALAGLYNAVYAASQANADALQGQNGQDAAFAAFQTAAIKGSVGVLVTAFREYAGPKVMPVAQVAAREIQKINPQTPAEKAAAVNTVGAAVQAVANENP